MWGKFFNILKLVLTLADSFQKLDAKVKEHGEQIRELSANQTRMWYEFQLQRERDAREREREDTARAQEAMWRENQQLRERLERLERLSLPPAPPDKQSNEK